jgi:hypothetical protein
MHRLKPDWVIMARAIPKSDKLRGGNLIAVMIAPNKNKIIK